MQTAIRIATLALSLVFAVSAIGCKSKEAWEKTYPTAGQITFKGKPVANAELTFFPTDPAFPETVRPRAKSDAEGKFQVWTYQQGDGAPSGNYKVTVVRNEVAMSKDTLVAKPNDLPPKYSKRDSTALEVKIASGPNTLEPFTLK